MNLQSPKGTICAPGLQATRISTRMAPANEPRLMTDRQEVTVGCGSRKAVLSVCLFVLCCLHLLLFLLFLERL